MNTEKTSLGSPRHHYAIHAVLRAPDRKLHEVHNLSQFVRDNPHLFLPEDIRNKSAHPSMLRCNATQGIAAILKGRNLQWKGWSVEVCPILARDSKTETQEEWKRIHDESEEFKRKLQQSLEQIGEEGRSDPEEMSAKDRALLAIRAVIDQKYGLALQLLGDLHQN